MKNAILLINGLGLGNSTRCKVIIDWLIKKNYKITIVTSGNGEKFFKNSSNKIILLEQIDYYKSSDNLSVKKLFLNLFKILKIVKKNSDKINNLIDKLKPNIVISDSVYFIPRRGFNKINSIALNNSNLVVKYFFKFKLKPFSIYPQFFFIEIFDYLISRFFYKKIWSPVISMSDFKNFRDINSNLITLPPISRFRKNSNGNFSLNVKNICIMLSGSSFKTKVKISHENLKKYNYSLINYNFKLGSENYDNHKYFYKKHDNYEILRNCEIAIINCGYSAISDCINLELPMILIPIKNHAEQYINSKIVESEKFGIICSDNIDNDIEKISNNYKFFKKNLIENKKIINSADYLKDDLFK